MRHELPPTAQQIDYSDVYNKGKGDKQDYYDL